MITLQVLTGHAPVEPELPPQSRRAWVEREGLEDRSSLGYPIVVGETEAASVDRGNTGPGPALHIRGLVIHSHGRFILKKRPDGWRFASVEN